MSIKTIPSPVSLMRASTKRPRALISLMTSYTVTSVGSMSMMPLDPVESVMVKVPLPVPFPKLSDDSDVAMEMY